MKAKNIQTLFSPSGLFLTASLAILLFVGAESGVAQTTDYQNDKTRTFVHEKASDALEQVNSILCMFDQTKYSDSSLLNIGYYLAMVDESLCDERDSAEKSGESSSGGTSASGAKEYTPFKVSSQRTSATAPQVVSAFVNVNGPNDTPMKIQAKFSITEGASEFNPLGSFTAFYKGSLDQAPVPVMRGLMMSGRDSEGRVAVKFAESFTIPGEGEGGGVKTALVRNTEGGFGSLFSLDEDQREGSGARSAETLHFAYNKSFFAKRKGRNGATQCFSRTSFETSAWRYGLYNGATGARVAVNSGFPINTQSDGRGKFAYVGYFGLFGGHEGEELEDGDVVYRIEPGDGAPTVTPYTVVMKSGKLKKHVRSEVTLSTLKNIPLEGSPFPPAVGQPPTMSRFIWNGTNLALVASASQGGEGPPSWAVVNPPTIIDATTTLMFGELGLYSQSLGGMVRIKLEGCEPVDTSNPGLGVRCGAPTNSTPVVFYKESTVKPTDATVPTTLSCFENCPKAGAGGMNAEDPTFPSVGIQRNYAFTNGLLTTGGNPVTLDEAPEGQSWGFNSGPLFQATAGNLALLACPWDPSQTCGWRAWSELSEFYTWETGPNSWNKYSSVRGGDNLLVEFQPPLQVKFIYPASGTGGLNRAAVDEKYAGNTFFLQYGSFGDLQGIPGKCFNPENPNDTDIDCSKPGRRWVPEFTIPAGSSATNEDGSVSYLIKPLEVEQRMLKVAASRCSGITITDLSASWPDLAEDWRDPNLGTEPDIADGAKVIAGELQ